METQSQLGYMLLADISGYTPFMAESELEHSQPIISDFLEIIIKGLAPPFSLAEVEGDAVFVYTSHTLMERGETVLELIESLYVAFRDRKETMHLQTSCTCAACSKIPSLDLKFVVHYGKYALQSIGGKQKPIGSDVNLVHRLLKNSVKEHTGWNAYALFTAPCLEKMGISPEGAHTQNDRYEHLGSVTSHSVNLDGYYVNFKHQRRIRLGEDNAFVSITTPIAAPIPIVWDWLITLSKKERYLKGTRWSAAHRSGGRTGVGSSNHCAHGNGVSVETILDWRPFEYYTTENRSGFMRILITDSLERSESGTTVYSYARLENRLPLWFARILFRIVMRLSRIKESYVLMAQLIEQSARE